MSTISTPKQLADGSASPSPLQSARSSQLSPTIKSTSSNAKVPSVEPVAASPEAVAAAPSPKARSAPLNLKRVKATAEEEDGLPPITQETPRAELATLVKAHSDRLFLRETENRWLFEMIRDEEFANLVNTFDAKKKGISGTCAIRDKYTDSKAYRSYQEAGSIKRLDQELAEKLREEAAKAEEGRAGRPMLSREVPEENRRDPLAFAEDMHRWEHNRQTKLEKKIDKLQREKDTAICGVPKISTISEQIVEARRKEDPANYPSYYSPNGVDIRIAEHRRKLEEIKKKHEPTFKPTITPHESLARRSEQQQQFFQNISAATGAAATDLSGVTAASTQFSPERLYALSKELKERQAAREMSAIPQTNCKKKSEAEIEAYLLEMKQRTEENERRKIFAAKRKAKETDQLENNGFRPVLNPNTDTLVEQYKSKEEKRNMKKEEQQRLREEQLAAEAARPVVVKTAPARTEEFFFHNERTMQKRSETLEKLQKEKQEKFSQSHTFTPAINNVSRKIAAQLTQDIGGPTFFETTEAQLWRQQAVEESLEQQYYHQQKEFMLSSHRPNSARFFVKGTNTTTDNATFDRQRAKEYAAAIPAPRSTSARRDRDGAEAGNGNNGVKIGGAIEVTGGHSPGGKDSTRFQASPNSEQGTATSTAAPAPYARDDHSANGIGSHGRPSATNNNYANSSLKTNSLDLSGPINYATNLSTPAEAMLSVPPPPQPNSGGTMDSKDDLGEEPVSDEEIGTPRDPRRTASSRKRKTPEERSADVVDSDAGDGQKPPEVQQPARSNTVPAPSQVPATATTDMESSMTHSPASTAPNSSRIPTAHSSVTGTARSAEDLLSRWRNMEADAARKASLSKPSE